MVVFQGLLCLLTVASVYSLEPLTSGWGASQQIQDDYVSLLFPKSTDLPQFLNYIINSTVPSTGRNYTMYVGLLRYGLPDSFSFELPPQGLLSLNHMHEVSLI